MFISSRTKYWLGHLRVYFWINSFTQMRRNCQEKLYDSKLWCETTCNPVIISFSENCDRINQSSVDNLQRALYHQFTFLFKCFCFTNFLLNNYLQSRFSRFRFSRLCFTFRQSFSFEILVCANFTDCRLTSDVGNFLHGWLTLNSADFNQACQWFVIELSRGHKI